MNEDKKIQTLRMEKLDTDYLEERLEYKRFLEELVSKYNDYYHKINNCYLNNNDIRFNFITYRYDKIKDYITNFLNSYNLGKIERVSCINKAFPEGNEIIIKFNSKCTNKDLLTAIWSEVQMLEYYTKKVGEVREDYLSFIKREEERYQSLLSREAYVYYVKNIIYFNQNYMGYIPQNIIYRIVQMLEKNYYFKDKDGNYNRELYVKGLKDLGLSREYIAELTGYTPEMMDEYYPNIPKNR